MRGGKWISCLVVAAFVVGIGALLAIAADKGPDVIELKSALWPTPTKKVLPFSHKKHYEEYKIACTDCHHVYKDGKNVWKEGDQVDKCDKCHTEGTPVEQSLVAGSMTITFNKDISASIGTTIRTTLWQELSPAGFITH